QDTAFLALATKYPEAKTALERSGKPMDVEDPELAQRIEAEYVNLLATETKALIQPLVRELEYQGISITTYDGLPTFTATLPKRVVLSLARRVDVSSIYLVEARKQIEMDSAAPTILAPTVWGKGYDGSGITIAILDIGNVDSNNTYLNLSPTSRSGPNNPFWHATVTASAAASFHSTYKGIAYGATILSVGEDGTQADEIVALQWAFTQGARILNNSGGFEADADIHWTDRAFDYWTRQNFRLVVKSSGNTGGYITSPGKAWNLITVGGIEDGGDATWSNDQMWAWSAYTNPVSPHSDREKPEVVAVSSDVTVLGNNNAINYDLDGTSMAAPQVSGLAALLVDRNSSLTYWPEANRAIIMASATHNIEGASIIVLGQGDLRDGAGATNADLADRVAQTRGSETGTCNSSCWWGHLITNSEFPVSTNLERRFYADQGDLIRVVIAWWAHADTPGNNYSFDQLDTDLDLRIKAPNGQWVSSASSLSYDNNYEMVQFLAPQTGEYIIAVRKARANEDSNYLGIALVRIPLPYRVYLPGVMKNYP
ncbi:MAG: S8 family serine peptidase, partial [Anaerolineae bacterium]|nr:S8 family serine peptidase [Anaerolineae bacterium]